ncbi:class I SAM-dependent methyltransferase [Leptospira kmetyi]|uniref:class I SAM-dependent methyltransferase n=1 Tax=Leptospira kmetyi TaxID=408139 RepID=UPI001082931D|nr:class I SAM-dependent methyltransferase [Leptospira kmetyi]TGK21316.1 class I SAM-dependent methyltransferase [Leptospira kmetyi]TGK28243.1 class I SAM-dependent methyltransferase [Leptospira kmetyi]TGL68392.1 class I SAM-dependent methyltransferase [Leptospira kmetyi]
MEQNLLEIREQQKESWNRFSQGWKKWDDLFMDFLQPMGDVIIHTLDLEDTDVVLDVAAGTGEPGLTIATRLNAGKVVITDLAEDMLEIARESAVKRGISNIETHVCDVCELPFENETFDAISCRFGFMFFPDMKLAASEMFRVLKPGGRIAASVWNAPEKNFWITAILGAIQRNISLPAPTPGAPGMFRCSDANVVSNLFRDAGLEYILVKESSGKLKCKNAETYWNVMTEVAAPIVSALSNADQNLKDKIKAEVFETLHKRYVPDRIEIESSAWIISGRKA